MNRHDAFLKEHNIVLPKPTVEQVQKSVEHRAKIEELVEELKWTNKYYMQDCKQPDPPILISIPFTVLREININLNKFGIFHTVNPCKANGKYKPTSADVTEIVSWAVDIDWGTKEEQWELIQSAPLYPSVIVESKNGFHVYYRAKDARIENYKSVVADRLVPFFKADKKATDPARLLRTPGFFHWKDPKDPFLVRVIHKIDAVYTEELMMEAFEAEQPGVISQESDYEGHTPFDIDCQEALVKLSGSEFVKGETYEFKTNVNGNLNIVVNGKQSGCFISHNKRIPVALHGPTAVHWLMFFGHSKRESCKILEGLFPQYAAVQPNGQRVITSGEI